MCLAVPAKIEKIEGRRATVAIEGNRFNILIAPTPDVKVGSWVLVHAGVAISVISQQQAEETFKLLKEASIVE